MRSADVFLARAVALLLGVVAGLWATYFNGVLGAALASTHAYLAATASKGSP